MFEVWWVFAHGGATSRRGTGLDRSEAAQMCLELCQENAKKPVVPGVAGIWVSLGEIPGGPPIEAWRVTVSGNITKAGKPPKRRVKPSPPGQMTLFGDP